MIFSCADLVVSPNIMQHIVHVESSGNPYAIGVVSGRLQRQPHNLNEALATVKMLEQKGYNFSLGIAQINRYNLKKYGLHSYEQAFQVCPNVKAASYILKECFDRARDWGRAFSCYYSGNFVTGYRHGYVQKIFASMQQTNDRHQLSVTQKSIPQVSNSNMVASSQRYKNHGLQERRFVTKGSQKSFQNHSIKSIKGGQEIEPQKGMVTLTEFNIDKTFVF